MVNYGGGLDVLNPPAPTLGGNMPKIKEVDVVDDTPKVTKPEEKPIVVLSKEQTYVQVIPRRDFHCCIGDVWYYFFAGKAQMVPPQVKEILSRDPSKLK